MLSIAEMNRLFTAIHIFKVTRLAEISDEDDDDDVFVSEPQGHSGLKSIGGQMPCSMPASLSPTPVSRRNSGPVGPRQTAVTPAPIFIGDDTDDYLPSAGTRVQGHRRLDRCLSEPTTAASKNSSANGGSRNVVGNSSRYKTELCRAFQETGHCKYGEKCQFAHGMHELRTVQRHRKYKTELCRTYHTIGFCPYGPRCHFIHNAEEARMNKPSSGTRPLSMSSSASSTTSSPTHSESLSGSPTSSFSMFWLPGDEDRLQMESPPTFHSNHHDLELFVASPPKPTVTVEFPDIFGAPIGGPRLPVFSRLAAADADPADR